MGCYISLFDVTTLVQKAGLEDTVYDLESTAFLASNNAAFDAIPSELYQYLTSPEGNESLRELINNHITPSVVNYLELPGGMTTATTLQGEEVIVESGYGMFTVDGLSPLNLYLDRWNIQYEFDSVLIPNSLSSYYNSTPTASPVEQSPRLDKALLEYIVETVIHDRPILLVWNVIFERIHEIRNSNRL